MSSIVGTKDGITVVNMENGDPVELSIQIPSEVNTIMTKMGCVDHPTNFSTLGLLVRSEGTHSAAINTKVRGIMGKGYTFTNTKDSREMRRIRAFTANPNGRGNLETFLKILKKMYGDAEVCGLSHIEIVKMNNIVSMYHVPAEFIYAKPVVVGGIVTNRIECWYQINPGSFTKSYRPTRFEVLPANGVLQNGVHYLATFSMDSPGSKSTFYSDPNYLGEHEAIEENMLIRRFGKNFFKNSAMPKLLITFSGGLVGKKEKDEITSTWATNMKGVDNGHKIAILSLADPQATVHVEKLTAVFDGDFMQQSEKNRDTIARVHGVFPKLLGISASGSLGSGSESTGSEKLFVELLVLPRQVELQDWVNSLFYVVFGVNPGIEFFTPDLTTEKDDAVIHNTYFNMGAMSINEIRQKLGQSKIDDELADKHFIHDPKKTNTVDSRGDARTGENTNSGNPDAANNVDPNKDDPLGVI